MKNGEDDSLVDASASSSAQIRPQLRLRVPGRSHNVTFAGVTVTVNNHCEPPF
jgi:hypothetical protein